MKLDKSVGGPYEIFFNPADERMSTKGRKVLSQPFAKRGEVATTTLQVNLAKGSL